MLVLSKTALERCRKHAKKKLYWLDTVAGCAGTAWYKSLIEKTDNPYATTDKKDRIIEIMKAYRALGVSDSILNAIIVFDTDAIDWSLSNIRGGDNVW